jgi:hypothetical protein
LAKRGGTRAIGWKIVVQVVGKFPLGDEARECYRLVGKAIEDLGYSLRFKQPQG